MAATAARSTRRRGASASERLEENYRQLRLVAGVQAGSGKAFAYQGGRKFLEAEGPTPSAAIDELKRLIDEIHNRRETSRNGSTPTPEEYLDALVRVDRFINPVQQTALIRHAARPDSRASFHQIASAAGVSGEVLQRAYVRLGRYLGDILNFRPERDDVSRPLQPILVLAEAVGEPSPDTEWALRESLVAAVDSWASKRR